MTTRSRERRAQFTRRPLRMEPLESRQLLASIALDPVADNTLYESTTGDLSNGVGQHLFVGRTNQAALRRALLRFDVGAEIPSGSTINSVSLQLHVSRLRSGSDTVALHEVLASWGEGSSNAPGEEGAGTTATAGDATWLHRSFNTSQWSQVGGDFRAAASASQVVGGIGDYIWSSAQMVQDVQGWLDNSVGQFGWLLKGNESANGEVHRFDSRENPTTSFRPVLTVDFTPPGSNQPPSDITLDSTSVAENTNTTNPVVVGDLSATDSNAGDSHTFTLVAGSGGSDNATFQITGKQLQFKAGTTLDHEVKNSYSVRVRATDSGGLSVEKSFSISVTDFNEAPTELQLSRSTVAKSTLGASVGRLTAIDPEPANSHTFTVSDTRFEVVGDTLKLKNNIALDVAAGTTINFDVTATDSGIPSASFTKTFAVTVTEATVKFQNPLNTNDVNGDGFVSPIDALIVINFLNDGNSTLPTELGDPPIFFDVSGDNAVSPIDALIVINFLNDASSSGEGEADVSPSRGSASLVRSHLDVPTRVKKSSVADPMRFWSLGDFDFHFAIIRTDACCAEGNV